MKYYLIAGEASGDLHGSNLMKGIREADNNADFHFFGGDMMNAQGGIMIRHYRDMAFMGLFKVVMNIRTIRKNLQLCKKDILSYQPDAIILIDFAGFNLRIAKFAKRAGLMVFYYISPKVWVWNKSRVKTIKQTVDRMFVILPFEVNFYRQFNYEVEYLGNPTLDAVSEKLTGRDDKNEFLLQNQLGDRPVIALLPGSRTQEIERCLPEMLALIPDFSDYQFVIAASPGIGLDFYTKYTRHSNVRIVFEQTYDLLKNAVAAVVTSGTATLETALLLTPEVVCYKTGPLSYHIGKMVVKLRFFSLVNLIMGKEVVKEFLQFHLKESLSSELNRIVNDETYRVNMIKDFKELRKILGEPGASGRIARRMIELVGKNRLD
ncbi:MAG: lipid-A-disaccharide synthase [Bacteroides sp. SM23_62_1]|nr:MAG: lipid-A-disaccharide synthase [Bacteroides sp. SM23_62_1]